MSDDRTNWDNFIPDHLDPTRQEWDRYIPERKDYGQREQRQG